jgi:hypothetical protein
MRTGPDRPTLHEEDHVKVRSDTFDDGARIPDRCAFGVHDPEIHVRLSDNLNPHLAWSDVPAGTKSFAIVADDPDAPTVGTDVNKPGRTVPRSLPRAHFTHWVLVDLPADRRQIAEGECSNAVTVGGKPGPHAHLGRHGLNDYTGWFSGDDEMRGEYHGYDGPCPPWNDERVHHYVFPVYALDVERLPVVGAFSRADVLAAVQGHVLGSAAVAGTFSIYPHAS